MYPSQKLSKVLEVVRSHDENMPVQRLAAFLYVAQHGKATREDVAESLEQSIASAYRNLMALSDKPYVINAGPKQGLGFLKFGTDPNESRRLVWELTAKGRRLKAQLEEAVE
jgi:DNA-binding MarR family transcriptional regulator